MPVYAHVGLALLWVIFVLELFVMTHVLRQDTLPVLVWAALKVGPLALVTLGLSKIL